MYQEVIMGFWELMDQQFGRGTAEQQAVFLGLTQGAGAGVSPTEDAIQFADRMMTIYPAVAHDCPPAKAARAFMINLKDAKLSSYLRNKASEYDAAPAIRDLIPHIYRFKEDEEFRRGVNRVMRTIAGEEYARMAVDEVMKMW